MIELILFACLLREPGHCERQYLPTAVTMGMMECVVTGQLQVARWHAEHPGWLIRHWSCGPPRA